jgi:DNA mismatch repair ATPase MutS
LRQHNGLAGVVAIKLDPSRGQKTVGVAFCDVELSQISVCQFQDNDQFSTLEGLLVQLGVGDAVE